jgi:hypothetical protein
MAGVAVVLRLGRPFCKLVEDGMDATALTGSMMMVIFK